MDLSKARLVVSIMTVVLLLTSLLLFINVVRLEEKPDGLTKENVVFVSSKLDYELARFIDALTKYENPPNAVDQAELLLRYDILWSRLSISTDGVTGRNINNDAESAASLDEARKIVESEEQAVINLDPLDSDERDRLIGRFSTLTERLHQVTINVLQREQALLGRESIQTKNAKSNLAASVISALLSAFVLIAMLLLEFRRAQNFARQNLSLMKVAQQFGRGIVVTRVREGKHIIEHYNKSFCDYTGHSNESITHRDLRSVLGHRSNDALDFDFNKELDQKFNIISENDDEEKVTHKSMRFEYGDISDQKQPSKYRLGVLHDITEQQQYESELILSKELAEAGSRAKSDFLATMSHEIRTPLNGIIGIMDILGTEAESDRHKHLLDVSRDSGVELLDIVNNILDFSKLESGGFESATSNFDLKKQLSKLEQLFKPACIEKGLSLTIVIADGTETELNGHASIVSQLLYNLVSNAVKFTPQGEVKIELSTSKRQFDLWLEILVSDSGYGIPESQIESIFEPFYQARSNEGRRVLESGTGLGLAICRRLVKGINGSIELLRSSAEGSTFALRLPVSKADFRSGVFEIGAADSADLSALHSEGRRQADSKNEHSLRHPLNNIHVLVAEDSKANQLVALNFLKSLGATVSLAVDGNEAVQMVTEQPFDLILMDIRMPDKDGKDAAREIRELNCEWRDLPIIAVTADAVGSERRACIEAGMNDYLEKPYSKEDLLHCVEMCLPLQRKNKVNGSNQAHDTVVSAAEAGSSCDRQPVAILSQLSEDHFNRKILLELQKHLSDTALDELMTVFINDADQRVHEIDRLIQYPATPGFFEQDTHELLTTHIHNLTGEADTFGAFRVGQIARELQSDCDRVVSKESDAYNDCVDTSQRLFVAMQEAKLEIHHQPENGPV